REELIRPSAEHIDHLGEARELGRQEAVGAALFSALMIPAVKGYLVDVLCLRDALWEREQGMCGVALGLLRRERRRFALTEIVFQVVHEAQGYPAARTIQRGPRDFYRTPCLAKSQIGSDFR